MGGRFVNTPIIGLQETHFKENDAKQLDNLARFKTHNSTYDGNGNRQKGARIFFSGNFWTEDECQIQVQ